MILVLGLQVGQCLLGLLQDLLLPVEQLLAKIFALPLVHERLFVGRPVALALVKYCDAVLLRRHCNPVKTTRTPSLAGASLYPPTRPPTTSELWRSTDRAAVRKI